MTVDFMSEAEAMRDELIARRRDLHEHPKLAFEEVRTANIVAEALTDLGMEVQTGIAKTGVIGILEGNDDGPTVLVRADMDALPIEEANDVPYQSRETGKMHACGHDGHVTIGLGVAKLLANHRDKLKGRIKFVFQPAEEIGQGAKAMIKDGALDVVKHDVTLGLHLWNTESVGKINIQTGPVMASASAFKIELTGQGGHGAMPHQTIDPVVCAAQLTMALQTIVSRNLDAIDAVVVTVGKIQSGSAFNIVPDKAVLEGTFRTFTREARDLVAQRIRQLTEGTAQAFGCESAVEVHYHTEPVINDETVVERVSSVFEGLGKRDDFYYERTMAAEDVGEFMLDAPGMFFFLGSGNLDKGYDAPHHHPEFDFDEDVLPIGVGLLAAAVGEYILKE